MKKVYKGKGRIVAEFTKQEREYFKLATEDTIVEICGDDNLMQEMYEYCKTKGIVGYDSETSGLNFFKHRMVLAQIGDRDRQYLIWLDKTNPDKLLQILRDPEVVKIGLNLKFDLTFGLYQYGMKEARAKNVVDVFLTAQVLMCGIYDNVGLSMRMGSMGTQAAHWLGLEIPKDTDLRVGWDGWDPEWFEERVNRILETRVPEALDAVAELREKRRQKLLYAADDVCIPISLAMEHKPWIQALGLVPTVNLENRFLPVLADIEARGMPFHEDSWLALADASELGAQQARHALDDLFDVKVTVEVDADGHAVYTRDKKYTSPEQLGDLIREWMWENVGVDVIVTNQHFKASLERYGRLNAERLEMLFTPMLIPDPENPGKKKKRGYPKMKDILFEMWDLYKHYLPDDAFILPNTDSKTLKFYKVIYEANIEDLRQDLNVVPTLIGLPGALVDPILDLRRHTKNVTTYGRNWLSIMSEDGRVHTSFVQASLSTGRLSSSPNAQNFPAKQLYRACFRAEPGYKMVGADYSQIEPRVLAHLSQDPTYMRVFWSEQPGTEGFNQWCDDTVVESLDLYTEVGKSIGQIPPHYTKLDTQGDDALGIEPKPDGKAGRTQSKVANLGLGYGTGQTKFHFMLCIDTSSYHTRAHTDGLFDTYWGVMRVVKTFLDQSSELANPNRPRKVENPYTNGMVTYAETILGRKRFFSEDNSGWWTQGRNMPIQGTAGGDMLKQAALELTEWAWDNDIEGGIVNLIHDELLGEVREDQAAIFAEKMQYYMEKVGQEMCPTVPIRADAYIEDFWRK